MWRQAARLACVELLERMEPWKKRLMEAAEDGAAPDFTTLVKACNGIFNVGHAEAGTKHGGDTFAKINLTAVGMWCPKLADVGAAVSYHSLGAACSEVSPSYGHYYGLGQLPRSPPRPE